MGHFRTEVVDFEEEKIFLVGSVVADEIQLIRKQDWEAKTQSPSYLIKKW